MSDRKHGEQWRAYMQLVNLDFKADLTLISRAHQQMQTKKTIVAAASASVGLGINKGISKILKYSTENTNPVIFAGKALEGAKTFTY
ncbi:unnamed protein product [Schistosoma margrebowiei]|uniref:Uncharacterized protein n=1 Tax=Schistosoma margrebowiei TaxID=48269 RepID=A0A183N466_9TREM|nr:unnamed protein product [Schistosoma margrebowiei]